MGCFVSKDKLTKEDMDFLKTNTSYDETTIKEWYKGFKVGNLMYSYTNLYNKFDIKNSRPNGFLTNGKGLILILKIALSTELSPTL